jgi:hypothetical protein
MRPTTMLAAALLLHQQGIRVIPLCWPDNGKCGCGMRHKDAGKAPLLSPGWQSIESTEEYIRAWWGRWPRANIGIRLELSGLVVIDTDSAEADAEANRLGLPITSVATTSKGKHYYFWRGAAAARRVIGWGASRRIDILGKGFVVAPPSLHASGTRYAWTDRPGPGSLPRWARTALGGPKPMAFQPQALSPARWREPASLEDAASALTFLDPDTDHDTWVKVGMAVHAIDSSGAGLAVWDCWSRRGAKYEASVVASKWDTFSPGEVGPATLFYLAGKEGWRRDGPGTAANAPVASPRREREHPVVLWARALAEASACAVLNPGEGERAEALALLLARKP